MRLIHAALQATFFGKVTTSIVKVHSPLVSNQPDPQIQKAADERALMRWLESRGMKPAGVFPLTFSYELSTEPIREKASSGLREWCRGYYCAAAVLLKETCKVGVHDPLTRSIFRQGGAWSLADKADLDVFVEHGLLTAEEVENALKTGDTPHYEPSSTDLLAWYEQHPDRVVFFRGTRGASNSWGYIDKAGNAHDVGEIIVAIKKAMEVWK